MKEAIRSLLALILLAGFLELMLPDDQMRKYSRMVVGLLVLFSLIQLMIMAGEELSLDIPATYISRQMHANKRRSMVSTDLLLAEGSRIRKAGEEKAGSAIKKRLEKKVNNIIKTVTGAEGSRTEIVISGQKIVRVNIYLNTETNVSKKSIKKLVGELLNIRSDVVEVETTVEGGQLE